MSLQLHGEGFSCSFNIFSSWPFITLLNLGSELYLTLTLLGLINLWSSCVFVKCLPNRLKNVLSIFVETLKLNGGLNHAIFLFLCLVLFITVDVFFCYGNVVMGLNPLSVNALLYKSIDLLNVVSSADQFLCLLKYIAWKIFNYILRMVRKNADIYCYLVIIKLVFTSCDI